MAVALEAIGCLYCDSRFDSAFGPVFSYFIGVFEGKAGFEENSWYSLRGKMCPCTWFTDTYTKTQKTRVEVVKLDHFHVDVLTKLG